MNMDSFDMILTIAALVMGVMLLTGHGDILMKGGNAAERKKLYDDKKVQLVSGVTLLIFAHRHRPLMERFRKIQLFMNWIIHPASIWQFCGLVAELILLKQQAGSKVYLLMYRLEPVKRLPDLTGMRKAMVR